MVERIIVQYIEILTNNFFQKIIIIYKRNLTRIYKVAAEKVKNQILICFKNILWKTYRYLIQILTNVQFLI